MKRECKGGYERDVLTRGPHRRIRPAGVRKRAKQRANRRERRATRQLAYTPQEW